MPSGGHSVTVRTYTISQFVSAFNVSRSALYRLWNEKKGPAFMRVGRRVLIPVDAAEAWSQSQMSGT
jgi:hypothetical protein